MKFRNKFISIGLGLALSFTGTYFSYSWFTDDAYLSHKISIGELVQQFTATLEKVYIGDCKFGGDSDHDDKCEHDELELIVDIDELELNDVVDFKIVKKSNNFFSSANKKHIEHIKGSLYEFEISLDKDSNNVDNLLNVYQEKPHFIIEITVKNNKSGKNQSQLYAVEVIRVNDNNSAHAKHKLNAKIWKISLEDNIEMASVIYGIPEEDVKPGGSKEEIPEKIPPSNNDVQESDNPGNGQIQEIDSDFRENELPVLESSD